MEAVPLTSQWAERPDLSPRLADPRPSATAFVDYLQSVCGELSPARQLVVPSYPVVVPPVGLLPNSGQAPAGGLPPSQSPVLASGSQQQFFELPPVLSPEQAVQLSLLEQKYAEERRQILLSRGQNRTNYPALNNGYPNQLLDLAWSPALRSPEFVPTTVSPALSTGDVIDASSFSEWQSWSHQPQQRRCPVIVMDPPVAHRGDLLVNPPVDNREVSETVDHRAEISVVRRALSQSCIDRQSAYVPEPPGTAMQRPRLLLPSQCERKRLHPSQLERSQQMQEQARLRTAAVGWSVRLPQPIVGQSRWGVGQPSASQPYYQQHIPVPVVPSRASSAQCAHAQELPADIMDVDHREVADNPLDYQLGDSRSRLLQMAPPRQQVLQWAAGPPKTPFDRPQPRSLSSGTTCLSPAHPSSVPTSPARGGRQSRRSGATDRNLLRNRSQSELGGLLNCFHQEPRQFPGLRDAERFSELRNSTQRYATMQRGVLNRYLCHKDWCCGAIARLFWLEPEPNFPSFFLLQPLKGK